MKIIIGIICFLVAIFLAFCVYVIIDGKEEFRKKNTMGLFYTWTVVLPLVVLVLIYYGAVSFGIIKIDKSSKTYSSNDSYQSTNYSASSQEKHYCYVCGKECSYEYGGQYYCPTHGAMVKAANEGK